MSIFARARSLWQGVRRRSAVEAEMNEEFRQHIEARARDLEATGLARRAALVQARREFGSTERFKEEARASRGLHRIDALRFSWLDFKLGWRVLLKHPGLTIIAGLGMAVAIAVGTGYSVAMKVLMDPTLPVAAGDRLVALQKWDSRLNERVRSRIEDFIAWREQLKTVQQVGAYRTVTRNLSTAEGVEPISIAEMSAVGFRLAGVEPLLGRYLLDEDEKESAPPVIVIGYDEWQRRFALDRSIIGRPLRIGTRMYTVIGVMPEKFGFPINHRFWTPLRANANAAQSRSAPSISVFGVLAPNVRLAEAQAELDVIDRRMAPVLADTIERVRAQVQPYTRPVLGIDRPQNLQGAKMMQWMIPLLTTLLLVVISVNVAILIYARTALRQGEILVRTAIGASRQRVIAQLFAEALVLAIIAAALGLVIAGVGLRKINSAVAGLGGGDGLLSGGVGMPFWIDFKLSYVAVMYAAGLAILAAVITGVLPALKATGARLQSSLQQLSSGGAGMLLGRTWTLLIIGQVALAVGLLPAAVHLGGDMARSGTMDPGFAAAEYLTSVIRVDDNEDASLDARYTARIAELKRRLESDAEVAAVTFASSVPGEGAYTRLEIEPAESDADAKSLEQAQVNEFDALRALVDVSFFDTFNIPVIAGRLFTTADADTSATSVIVSQFFAQTYLGGRTVLGRRLRYVVPGENRANAGVLPPWHEIVGVVPDFPNPMMPGPLEAKVYQAAQAGRMYPAALTVRLRGRDAATFIPQLRSVTAALDPALQVHDVVTLKRHYDRNQAPMRLVALAIALVTMSVLLLSAAGIYAMMSLAVARRRREIGIRAALGANPRRILAAIFARSSMQLGVGIAAGFALSPIVDWLALNGEIVRDPIRLATVSAIILTVGLCASIGPARRGLRIQPTEALKD